MALRRNMEGGSRSIHEPRGVAGGEISMVKGSRGFVSLCNGERLLGDSIVLIVRIESFASMDELLAEVRTDSLISIDAWLRRAEFARMCAFIVERVMLGSLSAM